MVDAMQIFFGLAEVAARLHKNDPEKPPAEDIEALEQTLGHLLLRYTPTPSGLGSGRADTVSKAVAATHSFGLSCNNLEELSSYLHDFVSLTTDMGVEMSLPAVRMLPSLSSFAPPWLRPLAPDGEDRKCGPPVSCQSVRECS